ncbi:MAG: glycosyltransferase [Lachnospiraceae bacterium]|nr:glycosyltransferase [Lachnospiraceae bacterium]
MGSSDKELSVCVIIPHYNDAGMTRHCISSLLGLNWDGISHKFIIVDNASGDGSGRVLKDTYADDPVTDVILLNDNEGYARGSNFGISHAVSKYDPDLIIVSNSDITVNDPDMPLKLRDIYEKTSFDIYGPDIFSTYRNAHMSPLRKSHLSTEESNSLIKRCRRRLRLLKILDKLKLYEPLRKIRRSAPYPDVPGFDRYAENVVIQGSFFVLSRGYLNAYPDGLYPGTFLYLEEDILNLRAERKGLKTVYDPSIRVDHSEGTAALQASGSRIKKYMFELEHTIESCRIFLTHYDSL